MKQLLPDLLFIRTKAVYTFVLFSSFFRDSVGRMVNLDAQIGKRFNKAERERLSFFFFFFSSQMSFRTSLQMEFSFDGVDATPSNSSHQSLQQTAAQFHLFQKY